MMIFVGRRESFETAGDVLMTYLDRIPSSERKAVQGIAEFLQSTGNVVGNALSLTVEVIDDD